MSKEPLGTLRDDPVQNKGQQSWNSDDGHQSSPLANKVCQRSHEKPGHCPEQEKAQTHHRDPLARDGLQEPQVHAFIRAWKGMIMSLASGSRCTNPSIPILKTAVKNLKSTNHSYPGAKAVTRSQMPAKTLIGTNMALGPNLLVSARNKMMPGTDIVTWMK